MYKFTIRMLMLMTSMVVFAYADKNVMNDTFISDHEQICIAKDNSSAELLIKTVIACQNVGRNREILPLFYLATDQHDRMMNIKMQENGTFTVGMTNEPFNFPLNQWRDLLEKRMNLEDQKYLLYALAAQRKSLNTIEKPRQIILKSIGRFHMTFDNAMPELGQQITFGSISYSGLDLSQEPPEELSNEGHIIQINGSYYIFNLPI